MANDATVARWIHNVGPHTSVRKAARRILRERLKVVESSVRRARNEADEKAIHHLRVSCRRADAVLSALRDVMKINKAEKARKWIRRIRRAAGNVREIDVHLAGLGTLAPVSQVSADVVSANDETAHGTADSSAVSMSAPVVAVEYVRDRLVQGRSAALRQFHVELFDLDLAKFRKLRRRIVRGLKRAKTKSDDPPLIVDSFAEPAPDTATSLVEPGESGEIQIESSGRQQATDSAPTMRLLDAARIAIPRFVDDVLVAAGEDLAIPEHLHALRIKGKALRYGIEIFSSCLGEKLVEESYPAAAELQERLGAINDAHELVRVLGEALAELGAGSQHTEATEHTGAPSGLLAGMLHLQADQQRRLNELQQRFAEWWRSILAADVLGRLERSAARLSFDKDEVRLRAARDNELLQSAGAPENATNERTETPLMKSCANPPMTPRQREAALIEVRLKTSHSPDLADSLQGDSEAGT